MPANEIVRIAVTVTVAQVICDLLTKKLVYQKEPYKRAVSALERAQEKFNRLEKEYEPKKANKQGEKVKKRLDQAENDLHENRAEVARRHSAPGILLSIVFLILFRILAAEHAGKVMAILPFAPHWILTKVSMRGLDFQGDMGMSVLKDSEGVKSIEQACSFTLIYLLCNMSVKFFAHKLIGETPPSGADQGIFTVMESPTIKRGLKQMGLDPDELKQD